MDFTGDIQLAYSEKVIIDSELELAALERHLIWGPYEDLFWGFEYNYRSSVAAVIHKKARVFCHIKNDEKITELFQKAKVELKGCDEFSKNFKEIVIKELGDERKPFNYLNIVDGIHICAEKDIFTVKREIILSKHILISSIIMPFLAKNRRKIFGDACLKKNDVKYFKKLFIAFFIFSVNYYLK